MNQSIAGMLEAPVAAVEAAGLFTSVCTVRLATNVTDAMGQVNYVSSTDPAIDGFADIAGVVAVPCMRAPNSPAKLSGGENDTASRMEQFNSYHVLLDGYFPQIPEPVPSTGDLVAVIDGVVHQVLAVEFSSQRGLSGQTRLEVRQVSL